MDKLGIPYHGKDAVSLLKAQHREMERLFAKYTQLSDKAIKSRQMLIEEIAIRFDSHSRLEEEIIYPLAMEIDAAMVLESIEEHEITRDMLGKLAEADPHARSYSAKVTVLRALIENHAKDEERDFFPKLETALGTDVMLRLGKTLTDEHLKMTGEDWMMEREKLLFVTNRSEAPL